MLVGMALREALRRLVRPVMRSHKSLFLVVFHGSAQRLAGERVVAVQVHVRHAHCPVVLEPFDQPARVLQAVHRTHAVHGLVVLRIAPQFADGRRRPVAHQPPRRCLGSSAHEGRVDCDFEIILSSFALDGERRMVSGIFVHVDDIAVDDERFEVVAIGRKRVLFLRIIMLLGPLVSSHHDDSRRAVLLVAHVAQQFADHDIRVFER
mmetsp:Transcript_17253/g.30959  ORF Transcript_17253/g.30959 Transcript_17253/m.30959 type:complete len:207 (-) Transcript_17253:530-1150(-)